MIDGLPLSFLLPFVVHVLAGMLAGVTAVMTSSRPERSEHHPRWGMRYLWAYALVFLTAIILSVQRWPDDASLFFQATLGYAIALGGDT